MIITLDWLKIIHCKPCEDHNIFGDLTTLFIPTIKWTSLDRDLLCDSDASNVYDNGSNSDSTNRHTYMQPPIVRS